MSEFESVITSIQNSEIDVESGSETHSYLLKKLGFRKKLFSKRKWYLRYRTKNELAKCLENLRDASFLFMGGHGWSPSAVFQDLREKEYASGEVREIVWSSNKKIIRKA